MIRCLLAAMLVLAPLSANAQQIPEGHASGMDHSQHGSEVRGAELGLPVEPG